MYGPRLAICLLGLLLGACRVPGLVTPTVKIGLVAPFEGRYRYVGYDLFPAVRQALREANASGGVRVGSRGLGYAVELVAYDDGADPGMAIEQAWKLVSDPDVVAVIGHFRDETTLAAIPVYDAADLPLVVPGLLAPVLQTGDAAVFQLGPEATVVAGSLLENVSAAALVSRGGVLGGALQDIAGERGLSLEPVVSPDDPGWLEAILIADPPVVLCDARPVTAGEVVAALRASGWTGEFRGGPELAAGDFAAVGEESAQGAVFATPWPFPQDTEGGAAFAAAYRDVSGGTPPGPLGPVAYQAARLVVEALKTDVAARRAPTRAGMAAALAFLGERQDSSGLVYWYRIGPGGLPQALEPGSP